MKKVLVIALVAMVVAGCGSSGGSEPSGALADRRQADACEIDEATARTAAEAYYAETGHRADMKDLVPAYLADRPKLFTVVNGKPVKTARGRKDC